MKRQNDNKSSSLKWFFISIAIFSSPFFAIVLAASISSGNDLIGISEKLKVFTTIFAFFTTPLSLIIAIIGGGMAYRKYFEDKEREIEAKEENIGLQLKIANKERANRLYDLLNSYTSAYDALQVAKSTQSIVGTFVQEIRDNVPGILKNIREIDPNDELERVYLKRFGIQ